MRFPSMLEPGRRRILVLTATMVPEPNASANLAVQDPTVRRRQYEQAFASYVPLVRAELDGIVLVENSGADLSRFARLAGPTVPLELLNVAPAPSAPGTRRGYLEMCMVSDAYASSELLNQPDAVGVKVTGRYRVENLGAVVRAMDARADLGFNLRRYPKRWADMWVFFANQRGMSAIRPHLPSVNVREPGGSAELSMFRIVNRLHEQGTPVQRRLPVEPRLSGSRGADAARYEGVTQRTKWFVRNVARRVAPGLWI